MWLTGIIGNSYELITSRALYSIECIQQKRKNKANKTTTVNSDKA